MPIKQQYTLEDYALEEDQPEDKIPTAAQASYGFDDFALDDPEKPKRETQKSVPRVQSERSKNMSDWKKLYHKVNANTVKTAASTVIMASDATGKISDSSFEFPNDVADNPNLGNEIAMDVLGKDELSLFEKSVANSIFSLWGAAQVMFNIFELESDTLDATGGALIKNNNISYAMDLYGAMNNRDIKQELRNNAEFAIEGSDDEITELDFAAPRGGIERFFYDSAEAGVRMIIPIGIGALTKKPSMSLALMSGDVAVNTYTRYMKETGGNREKSITAAKVQSLIEFFTEKLPVTAIIGQGKGGAMRTFLEATLGEGAQEFLASVFQSTYDATQLENMTFSEAVAGIDWGNAMYEAGIGAFIGGSFGLPATISAGMPGKGKRTAEKTIETPSGTTTVEGSQEVIDQVEQALTGAMPADKDVDPDKGWVDASGDPKIGSKEYRDLPKLEEGDIPTLDKASRETTDKPVELEAVTTEAAKETPVITPIAEAQTNAENQAIIDDTLTTEETDEMDAAAEKTLAKSEKQKKKTKENIAPNPANDDLATYIRKLGGINVESNTELAGRLKHLNKENLTVGLKGIEQKGDNGFTDLDELGTVLIEAGFMQRDPAAVGNGVDKHEVMDLLFKMEGEKVYSMENEAWLEAEAEAEYQDAMDREFEQAKEYEPLITPEDLKLDSGESSMMAELIAEAQDAAKERGLDNDAVDTILDTVRTDEQVMDDLINFIGESNEAEREISGASKEADAAAEKPAGTVEKGEPATTQQAIETTEPADTPAAGQALKEKVDSLRAEPYDGATMPEVEAIQDIPTTEKIAEALGTVGKEEFERRVKAYNKKYNPQTVEQKAAGVESVAIEIVATNRRESDDLVGKTKAEETQQAIQDATTEKDEKRDKKAVPEPEVSQGGDLFGGDGKLEPDLFNPDEGGNDQLDSTIANIDAIDKEFRSGDLLTRDLVEELQTLDDLPQEIQAAIDKYLASISEDFSKYGGRGDYEQYEAEFIKEYEAAKAIEQPKLVGVLPDKGIVVAGKNKDGTIYVGKENDQHFHLQDKYGTDVAGEMGYVGPDGKFLTKEEALDLVKKDYPDIAGIGPNGDLLEAMSYIQATKPQEKPAHISQPMWDAPDELKPGMRKVANDLQKKSMDELVEYAKKEGFSRPSSRPSIIEEAERRWLEKQLKKSDTKKVGELPKGSTVAIIACCKEKGKTAATAKDLYQGQLFKASMKYANSIGADKILILSAKHGLIELDQRIEPYDETLKSKSVGEMDVWNATVRNQMSQYAEKGNLGNLNYVFLAGKAYREGLISRINQYAGATIKIPLEGLGIGKQLSKLKELTAKSVPRQNPFKDRNHPDYVFNETGELKVSQESIADIALQTAKGNKDAATKLVVDSMKPGKARDSVVKMIAAVGAPEAKLTGLESFQADAERIKSVSGWRAALKQSKETHPTYFAADHINQEWAEAGWIAGYLYAHDRAAKSASPAAGDKEADVRKLDELDVFPGYFINTHFIGQSAYAAREDKAPTEPPTDFGLTDEVSSKQKLSDEIKARDAKRSGLDRGEPLAATAGDDLFALGGELEADLFVDTTKDPRDRIKALQVELETVDVDLAKIPKDLTDISDQGFDDLLELQKRRRDIQDELSEGLRPAAAAKVRAELRQQLFDSNISTPKYLTIEGLRSLLPTEDTDAKPKKAEKKAKNETKTEQTSRLRNAPGQRLGDSKVAPTGKFKALADINLKMDTGTEVITHTAEYWLNDIDGRILEMNKLRDCM